ncbi:MAG: hypothetical protein PVF69_06410 [Gemmatimonadota bacterium]|jgi:hypothetical protein
MRWESALGSIIEVAIAIAGFSGIVAAVGRRSEGHWTDADQLRLRILLTASGVALVFAFLPFVLVDLAGEQLVWRAASALLAIHMGGISAYRVRQASVAGIIEAIGLRWWTLGLQAVVALLLLVNAFYWASASVYVLGVLWGLLIAFLAFVSLLLGGLRHAPEDGPPAV